MPPVIWVLMRTVYKGIFKWILPPVLSAPLENKKHDEDLENHLSQEANQRDDLFEEVNNTLYAFYDLQVSPPTFDIVNFLSHAEAKRLRLGAKNIHLVIPPGPINGFRDASYQTVEEKQWRKRNICLQASFLHPMVTGVSICSSRLEAQKIFDLANGVVFPTDYTVTEPKMEYLWSDTFAAYEAGDTALACLATSNTARGIALEWSSQNVHEKKLVTITLRESDTQSFRNSNFGEWQKFIDQLDHNEFAVLIIGDVSQRFNEQRLKHKHLLAFPEVLFNLELRSAIYEISHLNLFVSNGPMMVAIFNSFTNFLAFKFVEEREVVSSVKFLEKLGFEIGKNLPFCGRTQKVVWATDDADVIGKEFECMTKVIDNLCFEEFDQKYFAERYGFNAVDMSKQQLFAEYKEGVGEECYNPNSWFDERWYRQHYSEVGRAVNNGVIWSGFFHYSNVGRDQFFRCNSGDDPRLA